MPGIPANPADPADPAPAKVLSQDWGPAGSCNEAQYNTTATTTQHNITQQQRLSTATLISAAISAAIDQTTATSGSHQ